jgi:hypothetical protein
MIKRLYQRFKVSSARGWMIIGAMLGICALPCPECGTPLIFHGWPIAGLVLAVRALKKHYQEKKQVVSETVPSEQGLPISACHHESHWDG